MNPARHVDIPRREKRPDFRLALRLALFVGVSYLVISATMSFAATMQASLQPSFQADLTNSLIPSIAANGSKTPAFTRATTATFTDFEGIIRSVLSGEARFQGARRVANLVPTSSEDFTVAGWQKLGSGTGSVPTVTNITATRPDGTVGLVSRAQFDRGAGVTGGDISRIYWNNGSAPPYDLQSMWIKTYDGSSKTIYFTATNPLTVDGTWRRYSGGRDNTFQVGTIGNNGGSQTADLLIWGAQDENVVGQSNITQSEYVSKGVLAAPYHGAGVDGVQYFKTLNGNTVASNVVTEATGALITSTQPAAAGGATAGVVDAGGPLGYLAEGGRTNYMVVSSEDLTQFTPEANASVTATTVVAPDGGADASLVVSAGGVTSRVYEQSANLPAGAQSYAFSAFVKKDTVDTVVINPEAGSITGTISFTFSTEALTPSGGWSNGTVTKYPNGWYRISATGSSDGSSQIQTIYIYGGNGFAAVGNTYWWGIQLEVGSFPSSYFWSGSGAAKSRAADILLYPTSGNISGTTGTAYAEITAEGSGIQQSAIDGYSGGSTGTLLGILSGGSIYLADPADRNFSISPTRPSTTIQKIATKWSGSSANGYLSGVAGTPQIFDGDLGLSTNFSVGSRPADTASIAHGTVRNVKIWPRALTDAQLTKITTLANNAQIAAPKVTQGVSASKSTVNSLTSGLVGYWPLDGKDMNWTNGVTLDESGQGNYGTLNNMSTTTSPVQGKIGQALKFDGVASYVDMGTSSLSSGAITVSMWVKPNVAQLTGLANLVTNVTGLILYQTTATGGRADKGVLMGFRGNPEMNTASTVLTLNQWNHVVFVYNGGAKNLTSSFAIYSNAVSQSLNAIGGIGGSTTSNRIGSDQSSAYWSGQIDDVRIYNRALSASEVKNLYNQGNVGIKQSASQTNTNIPLNSGLVGYWTFDGKDVNWGTGVATDKSAGGDNGSVVNMSTTTSPTQGKIGQALQFNGSTSYVAPATNPIHGASTFTTSAWIYKTSTVTADIMSNRYFPGPLIIGFTVAYVNGVGFGLNNHSIALCTASTISAHNNCWSTPTDSIAQNTWYHVTVVWQTGSTPLMYINGVSQTVTAWTGATNDNPSTLNWGASNDPFWIGRGSHAYEDYPWAGKIDDVRIYNRALSATEVKALYNQAR